MGRTVKFLGARTVSDDQAKVLALIPLFPGESIDRIKMDCYTAALTDEDVSNPIMLNWNGIGIPWPLVDAADPIADGTQPDFSTVAQYDALFTQYMLSANEGASELFGGDVDLDPEEDIQTDDAPAEDPLLTTGPPGAYQWFSQEILGRPYAAAGNATIRFGDDLRTTIGPKNFTRFPWGQLLIFGMIRNDASQTESNFNIELDDITSIRGLWTLRAGDNKRVESLVKHDTDALGDWVRTVLFGGDNFIEASTLKSVDVKAYVKMSVHISGPLSRGMSA